VASFDPRSRNFLRYLQLVSAFVGIALSLYLLAQHTRVKSGIQGGSSFCSFGKHADCDLVNASQYSEVFGIPLAGIGAVYFFVMLLLVLVTPKKPTGYPAAQTWIARLSLAGLGLDTILLGIQIGLIKSICVLCFTTYLSNVGLFIGAAGRRGGKWKDAAKGALQPEGNEPLIPQGPMRFMLGLSLVLFTVIVGLIPSAIRLTSKNYALVDSAIEQFLSTWPEKKVRVIDWKAGDGVKGNPRAPVRMVVFSDFECPFCRQAAFTMHTALEPFKDEVFLVFKQFPLDPSCNPTVQYQTHPNACALARLAYCANRRGKFWEYHDTIFMKLSQEAVASGIDAVTPGLSSLFTKEEIASCLSDPATLDNIAQDARLGRSLDLKGTPSVYVNGKAVSIPLTVENLRRIVSLELSLQPKSSP
jgi:protein-disulfide isomerase/uncharacterized membrane protein